MLKTFKKIASETAEKCAAVKCSKREYKDGLEEVIATLEMSLDAVKDELRQEEGEE